MARAAAKSTFCVLLESRMYTHRKKTALPVDKLWFKLLSAGLLTVAVCAGLYFMLSSATGDTP